MVSRLAVAWGIVAIVACATATRPGQQGDAPPAQHDAPPPMPDAMPDGNNCATQPCSILPQCGCGANMACDINVMTQMGTACRSVAATGHETDHCTSSANCDVGYVCLGPAGQSSCKKYCASTADCGAPRGQCVIDIVNSMNMPIAGIPPVCSSSCDPTGTTGCPSAQKCSLYTAMHMGTSYNIVDCGVAGTGVQGANCKNGATGDDTMCAPDFLCTTLDNTSWACRKICAKAASNCGAMTCLSFNPAFSVGGTEYGVCN